MDPGPHLDHTARGPEKEFCNDGLASKLRERELRTLGIAMSLWDLFDLVVTDIERNFRTSQVLNAIFSAAPERNYALQRGLDLFGDGHWHHEEDIVRELGRWTVEVINTLVHDGHDFENCWNYWRMVHRAPTNGPLHRGTIRQAPCTPGTSKHSGEGSTPGRRSAETSNGKVASATGTSEAAAVPTVPTAPDRDSADDDGPRAAAGSTASETKATCANATKVEGKEGAGQDQVTMGGAGPLGTSEPEEAVHTASPKPATIDTGLSPTVSSPPSASAGQAVSANHPELRLDSAGTEIGQSTSSSQDPITGTYCWANSPHRADLIARGVVTYRRVSYLAVDIVREKLIIARVAVDRRASFFDVCTVALAREVTYRGRRLCRYDTIRGCKPRPGEPLWFPLDPGILAVPPRFASAREAFRLRKNRQWPLPSRPGREHAAVAIRNNSNHAACVPLVVKIERRKTSEPVVKVHFCSHPEGIKSPYLDFHGDGYMSWSSAIALARCGQVGVKIALPKGGWIAGELAADVSVAPNHKEYGRGLSLVPTSLPESAQEWARNFPSIFDLPLRQSRRRPALDWRQGFPPTLRSRSRRK